MRQPIAAVAFLLASGLFFTFGSAAPHGSFPTDDRPSNQPPAIGTTDQPIIELDPSPNLQAVKNNRRRDRGHIESHPQQVKSLKKRGNIFGDIFKSITGVIGSAFDQSEIERPFKPLPQYFLPQNITDIYELSPGSVKRNFHRRVNYGKKIHKEITGGQSAPVPVDGSSRGPTRGADASKGPADAENGRPKPADEDLAEQAEELASKPAKTRADIVRGRVLANAVKNKKFADSTRRRNRVFTPGNVNINTRRRSTGSPDRREAISGDTLGGAAGVAVDFPPSVEEVAQKH